MAKATRRKAAKKSKTPRATKGQTKTVEYLDCLLELHKLQGELLAQLREEI